MARPSRVQSVARNTLLVTPPAQDASAPANSRTASAHSRAGAARAETGCRRSFFHRATSTDRTHSGQAIPSTAVNVRQPQVRAVTACAPQDVSDGATVRGEIGVFESSFFRAHRPTLASHPARRASKGKTHSRMDSRCVVNTRRVPSDEAPPPHQRQYPSSAARPTATRASGAPL